MTTKFDIGDYLAFVDDDGHIEAEGIVREITTKFSDVLYYLVNSTNGNTVGAYNEENLSKVVNHQYDPITCGTVVSIRIFFAENTTTPMATLEFAYESENYPEKKTTIEWTNIYYRKKFEKGITGYTLIYDDRVKAHKFDIGDEVIVAGDNQHLGYYGFITGIYISILMHCVRYNVLSIDCVYTINVAEGLIRHRT